MHNGSDRFWGVPEAAALLGVPVATLDQWRSRRCGPPGRRVGRYIRHDRSEVRAWFDTLDDHDAGRRTS